MQIEKIEEQLELLKVEWAKFERGNKSAGTRARKVLQDIKRTCQEMRDRVQEVKKGEGDEA
jgi:hypothetical protein